MKNFFIIIKSLFHSLWNRIVRFEANLLIINLSLLLAFHFPIFSLLQIFAFSLILLSLMYFTNDYFDVELDLKSPIKNHTNVRLIKKNKSVFGFSIFVIFLLLLAFAYSIGMKIFLATSVALLTNLLYSLKFKRMLALDLVALFIWSASIVYLAVPGFDVYGLKLAILMGIMTMASHVIQCMRDYKFDKLYNVDTTVVRIGREKSKKLLKLILMVIPLYSIFVLNNPFGVVLLISLFFNFDQKIEKYWLKIKILFMILWVFLILSTFTGI